MSDAATIGGPTTPLSNDAAPAWDRITDDVRCPLCDYNLRGLPQPRCPECGGRFTWEELLARASAGHPYLFEGHPESNVRSYLRTAWEAMRPRRFWTGLRPALPIRPGRLVVYWVIGACLAFVIMLLYYAAESLYLLRYFARFPGGMTGSVSGASTGRLRGWITGVISGDRTTWTDLVNAMISAIPWALHSLGVLLAWGLLTLAAMQIFRISMRRARIRPTHTFRMVIYSFDPVVWALVAAIKSVLMAVHRLWGGGFGRLSDPVEIMGFIFCGWRLYEAYRQYLRFDHPFSTVLACQVIVLLLMANLLLFMGYLR